MRSGLLESGLTAEGFSLGGTGWTVGAASNLGKVSSRGVALVLVGVLGCGRVAFEARSDGSITQDGVSADGTGPDGAASDLLLHVAFEGDGADLAGGRIPTCIGCPLTFSTSPGGAGQALQLSGAECLEYADDPMLRPASFTLSAWFRMGQLRTSGLIGKAFDADTSEANSYEFWVADVGQVLFSTVDGNNPYVWADTISPATWYHVAGTVSGATKRIYVDGVERMMGTILATSYDVEPFRIGCDRGMGNVQNFFIGDVDDVRLYGRALAPGEIADLAAAPP